jgi:hypothetical protein
LINTTYWRNKTIIFRIILNQLIMQKVLIDICIE